MQVTPFSGYSKKTAKLRFVTGYGVFRKVPLDYIYHISQVTAILATIYNIYLFIIKYNVFKCNLYTCSLGAIKNAGYGIQLTKRHYCNLYTFLLYVYHLLPETNFIHKLAPVTTFSIPPVFAGAYAPGAKIPPIDFFVGFWRNRPSPLGLRQNSKIEHYAKTLISRQFTNYLT